MVEGSLVRNRRKIEVRVVVDKSVIGRFVSKDLRLNIEV